MLRADELLELLALAESTSVHAGRMLRAKVAHWQDVELEEGRDVKMRADREAEHVVHQLLSRGSDFEVFGEESGLMGSHRTPLTWVVDPLDGTANYQRDIPLCVVSIALCAGDEPLLGVIYDFNADEVFSGVHVPEVDLKQATLAGAPMRVSKVAHASEGILGTGFPVAADLQQESVDAYIRSVQSFRKVRSLGSAALMLAYVASGRFDGYWERSVRFWDVAAGMALVKAAGGNVTEQSQTSGFDRKLDLRAWNGVLDFV